MKINNLIPIIILIGFAVLFFFPEPETNFLAYMGTALLFVVITIILLFKNKKR